MPSVDDVLALVAPTPVGNPGSDAFVAGSQQALEALEEVGRYLSTPDMAPIVRAIGEALLARVSVGTAGGPAFVATYRAHYDRLAKVASLSRVLRTMTVEEAEAFIASGDDFWSLLGATAIDMRLVR